MSVKRAFYFDMDGTIADLYAVPDWLNKLRSEDATPYKEAKPMVDMAVFARLLNRLSRSGFEVNIISWASKGASEQYYQDIISAKIFWLNKHLPSVPWDRIIILPYGTPKSAYVGHTGGILFDDDKRNRDEWDGVVYPETNLIETLKQF